jgi:hypothetical protein
VAKSAVSGEEYRAPRTEGREFPAQSLLDEFSIPEILRLEGQRPVAFSRRPVRPAFARPGQPGDAAGTRVFCAIPASCLFGLPGRWSRSARAMLDVSEAILSQPSPLSGVDPPPECWPQSAARDPQRSSLDAPGCEHQSYNFSRSIRLDLHRTRNLWDNCHGSFLGQSWAELSVEDRAFRNTRGSRAAV